MEARSLLIENLERYHAERVAAEARERRQVEACIAAGYDSPTIAAALGCKPNNVRSMPAWRDARRKAS